MKLEEFNLFLSELSKERLADYRSKAKDTIDSVTDLKTMVKRVNGARMANAKIAEGDLKVLAKPTKTPVDPDHTEKKISGNPATKKTNVTGYPPIGLSGSSRTIK